MVPRPSLRRSCETAPQSLVITISLLATVGLISGWTQRSRTAFMTSQAWEKISAWNSQNAWKCWSHQRYQENDHCQVSRNFSFTIVPGNSSCRIQGRYQRSLGTIFRFIPLISPFYDLLIDYWSTCFYFTQFLPCPYSEWLTMYWKLWLIHSCLHCWSKSQQATPPSQMSCQIILD